MTVLNEETCRTLIEKLCSGLGWKVRRAPEPIKIKPFVLFTNENRWCAFGATWKELYENFHESSYEFIYPFNDIPRWIRLCSSPEELALKIEVSL